MVLRKGLSERSIRRLQRSFFQQRLAVFIIAFWDSLRKGHLHIWFSLCLIGLDHWLSLRLLWGAFWGWLNFLGFAEQGVDIGSLLLLLRHLKIYYNQTNL